MDAERAGVRALYAPARHDAPNNQTRPTVVFALAFVAAMGLDELAPMPASEVFRRTVPWAGGAALAGGAILTTWCLLMFGRLGTGIMPDRPARRLVTEGPYAWSRNPMFVGFVLMYLGAAWLIGSLWALALLPLAITVTTVAVIRREERYMRQAFGTAYDRYARRVNRWIGRRPV